MLRTGVATILILTLHIGVVIVSALNLDYLDPTKLQTVTGIEAQENAANGIIRKYLENVAVTIDPAFFKDNKDAFRLKTWDGILHIRASTGVAAVWGFNYYLKKYCKSQIEWQTKNVRIPSPLPEVDEVVTANDRFRYYQNVCTASYSFVWWKVSDWMDHVEWMALNGINLALAPVAQEAAWANVYRQIGMNEDEIAKHFTGPAFLSWLRMGNVRGWGGPLPQIWHDTQIEIQNNIIDFMLQLGIVPVLPAFNGHVPVAFRRLYPNSKFHNVDQWNKFGNDYCCGLYLDPTDKMFEAIGGMFFNAMAVKGKGIHIYTADPFNEVQISNFSTALVQETAMSIFLTLTMFDSNAVWLLQNWMFVHDPLLWPVNRVKAFITSVPNGRMLILDLQAEQWPQYDIYEMYYGQPFIWCMLHNFGGTMGMFGNMVTINRDVYEVRQRLNTTMIGIGLTPEGINQNYVVYDLMLESAWRGSPVPDLEQWVADYAERRYGCNSLERAWKYLLKSVYSFNGLNRIRGKYVLTRKPSLKIKPWAWYKSSDLFEAFKEFVFVNNEDCNTEGFQYDLVDVTRQALQYRIDQLYVNVINDRFSTSFILDSSIKRFLGAFDDLANILVENNNFIASTWFSKATGLTENGTSTDAYLYELNARNQITLWGPNGEISDYACKQWYEVVRDYYRPRWATFLNAVLEAKKMDESFSEQGTKRVVTTSVEIPFDFMFSTSTSLVNVAELSRSLKDMKDKALSIYKSWAYAPDVEDLPVIIILTNNISNVTTKEMNVVTMMDMETDPEEISRSPTVVMYPTSPAV